MMSHFSRQNTQIIGGLLLLCFGVLVLFRLGNLSKFNSVGLVKPQILNKSLLTFPKKCEADTCNDYSDNESGETEYIIKMMEWSISPNSFCFENYLYTLTDKDSSYVILSITNLNELNRNLTITKKFIFYLRISRILYANKYTYKYCEFQETFDISKPPHWSKWNAIRMVSTLKNIQHIIWIDVDAIFHSKTKSFERSSFYLNDYATNKLFVFAPSQQNRGINAGIFMVNTNVHILDNIGKNWDFLDILDLFSFIEMSKKLKTYVPPYEQWVLRVFQNKYRKEFNRFCVMLGLDQRIQSCGSVKGIQLSYEYFIWHLTGINERYQKMIPIIEREIGLFLDEILTEGKDYILDLIKEYTRKYSLDDYIESAKNHIFPPDWIKKSLICESAWWNNVKSMAILGKIYNKQERKAICEQTY